MTASSATSPSGARLIDVATPAAPVGLVLVLHGGAQRQVPTSVRGTQLSVLRMIPVARSISRAGRGRVAVHRLLNSRRGWDREHAPTADVAWALEELRERHRDLPVVLVGHSLGGRAALVAGGVDASVTGVVALNPWLYPNDDVDLQGRSVLIVHGDADRVAPLDRARAVASRLSGRAEIELVVVPGGKHPMLGRAGVFTQHTTDFVARVLLDDEGSEVSR